MRSRPIDVTLVARRMGRRTVKCYSACAMDAAALALFCLRRDGALPRGSEILGIEFDGCAPGDPVNPRALRAMARQQGFRFGGG